MNTRLALLGALALSTTSAALAQTWPTRPLRLLVGFPPGGPTDVVGRLVAERLTDQLRQQVVIDNRPGAAGNIAAEMVAKANPDGYTLLFSSSAIALSPGMYSKLGYDPVQDLAPITEIGSGMLVLAVHPSLPVKTVREFIDYAKARPGQLNYGSSGAGTGTHFGPLLFSRQVGIETQHIPYKGTAPTLVDAIAGRVQFIMGTLNTALPHIRDNRLRALAVTGLKRSAALPDAPTLDEAGVKGFLLTSWQAMFAPARTPPAVLDRIHAEVTRALRSAEMKPKLEQQDVEATVPPMAEFTKSYRAELAKWTKLAKEVGLKAD